MELRDKIEEFIVTEICDDLDLDVEHINDDERLIEKGILDSLGILKLLNFLDEEMDIDISANEVRPDNFTNIKTICELIEKQTGTD